MTNWYDDIGELITSFNTDWFPQILEAFLHKIFKYDYFLLVLYEKNKSMHIVHSDFQDIAINQALVNLEKENYVAEAIYRLFSADELDLGIYSMKDLQRQTRELPSMDIDISNLPHMEHCGNEEMEYRTLGWPKFLKETCIVCCMTETHCAAISLYDRGIGGAKKNNVNALQTIFPVISSLVRAYFLSPFGRKWYGELASPLVGSIKTNTTTVKAFFIKRYNVILTSRELDVFSRLLMGRAISAIADELGVSIHTAKTHRRNVYNKIGTGNQIDLMNQYNIFKTHY